MALKTSLKMIFPGVSWQNPLLNLVFQGLNPVDYLVRAAHGLTDLPPYSIRVRSNGVTRQFGGQRFAAYGTLLANLLQTHAALDKQSQVLEIGCGCGRTAFALARILNKGNFVGMDIEKVALESCKHRPLFIKQDFKFEYLDVQNDLYNPQGTCQARQYTFPYDDESYNVIFLVSVFTHMVTADVINYIQEIARMLKPGGRCMLTTFLMDQGRNTQGLSFPYNVDAHYFYHQTTPEVYIGYYLDFYVQHFAANQMKLLATLWGSWRQGTVLDPASGFSQDILVFTKES